MEEESLQPDPRFIIGFETGKVPSYPVGGAYGGPTPDGTAVVAHFYIEYVATPYHLRYDKVKEGDTERVLLETEEKFASNDITRELQTTVFMTPEVAMTIGQWLVEKGQAAKNRRDNR